MAGRAPVPTEHHAASPVSPVAVGSTLPSTQWKIEAWVRQGPRGGVFEATHTQLGRRAQIELCEAPTAALREDLSRAAELECPFVVRVLDVVELGPRHTAIVTESVPDSRMATEPTLGGSPISRLIGIGRQLSKAIHAMHERGLIHGRVEPATIIPLDHGLRIKLQDPFSASPLGVGSVTSAPSPVDDLRGVVTSLLWLAQREDVALPAPLRTALERGLAIEPGSRGAGAAQLELALCEAQLALGIARLEAPLTLPSVDSRRRHRLERRLAALESRSLRRRWALALAVAIPVTLGTAGWLTARALAPSADHTSAQRLAQRARDAAARAHYVYPPPTEPEAPTSFLAVLELERALGVEHPTAHELRDQFADTLVFLGDKYWASPGGQTFALDFYAQALLFRPDDPRARERGQLSPGQLATLYRRAEHSDFTEAELLAVEPLAIMADPDDERRLARLRALLADGHVRPRTLDQQLRRLVTTTDSPPSAPPAVDPAALESAAPPVEATSAPDDEPPARPDPEPQVATLRAQAKRAFAQGQWRRAQSAWNQALALDQRCAPCLVGLSDIAFERAKHHEAVDYARRASRIAPRRAGYRIKLGDAYMKVLKYDDAAREYQRAKQLGHPQADECLARVRAKTRP